MPEPINNQTFAERVVASFNTNAFRRHDSRISKYAALLNLIDNAHNTLEPVQFVMYWGKGSSAQPGIQEYRAIDYLIKFFGRFKSTYPEGFKLTIIATDTHIRFNGYGDEDAYFAKLSELTKNYPIEIVRMSSLLPSEITQPQMDEILSQYQPSTELLKDLIKSATKHYKGSLPVEQAALNYYAMNIIESKAIEAKFGNNVFLTYNSDKYAEMFPQTMPAFYMQSTRGHADKPWFH